MKEKNALITVLSITVAWMGYQLWDHNNRPRPCAPSAQASATPSAPLMSTAQEKPSERGTPIHIRNRNVRGTIDTKGPCVYQWALTKYVETNDTNERQSRRFCSADMACT
jgi:YidC/Oxa1 family membrane protein insertase